MTVRTYAGQKAALTRVLNRYQAEAQHIPHWQRYEDGVLAGLRQKVVDECRRTVREWESAEWAARYRVRQGAWPDDWARWERALHDADTRTFTDLRDL